MARKKNNNLPIILLGAGAFLLFSSKDAEGRILSGAGAGGGANPLGLPQSSPLLQIPNFNFGFGEDTTTSPNLVSSSIPLESKKSVSSSGFPSQQTFGTGGFTDVSGVRVFQDVRGNIIGGESLITQQSITAQETKKQISSGGGGGRSIARTPLTKQVQSGGGSFTGTSSLKNKKQAKQSESRAESLFARIGGS